MVNEGGRERESAVGLALASSLRRAPLWLLPRRGVDCGLARGKKVTRRDFSPGSGRVRYR